MLRQLVISGAALSWFASVSIAAGSEPSNVQRDGLWVGQERNNPETGAAGFVTDFASIPRPFWSLLRPDGEYAYAAIIHDYLYWTQARPRPVSNQIFKQAMEDFSVGAVTVATIYGAVRVDGASAWRENARLKAAGERRILKEFPDDPRISWSEWKARPGVFRDPE